MSIKVSKRIGLVEEYYFSRKLKQIADMNAAGLQVINLGIGSPDLPPPASVIHVLNKFAQEDDVHSYQSYRGISELRRAWADWYFEHFEVSVDPENEILPLIGSKEGIMHISMTYLDEGDQVLLPNPGYPTYRSATLLAGGEPLYYDLTDANGWHPDFKRIKDQDLSKVKLMWLNYPHMPTGTKANMQVFESCIKFAENHNILLCHDNPYAFIRCKEPMSILQVDHSMANAIELNSLSKTFNMAGWRVGVGIGHADRINEIIKFKSNMDSGMFKPIQMAAVKALHLGKSWYHELNKLYTLRAAKAVELLQFLGCSIPEEQSGMFVWARIPKYYGHAEHLSDLILEKAQVFITPGHIFGSNGDQYVRISLCSSLKILEQAMKRCETNEINIASV